MKYRMIVFEDDTAAIQKRYHFWPFWMTFEIQGKVVLKMRHLHLYAKDYEYEHYVSVEAARTALIMWLDQEDADKRAKRKIRNVAVDILTQDDCAEQTRRINEAFG